MADFSLPPWLQQPNPAQFMLQSAQAAEGIGRNFTSAFNAAQAAKAQREQLGLQRERVGLEREQLDLEKQKQQRTLDLDKTQREAAMKFFDAYSKLNTTEERLSLLAKTPHAMLNPYVAKPMENLLDMEAKTDAVRSKTAEWQAKEAQKKDIEELKQGWGLAQKDVLNPEAIRAAKTNRALSQYQDLAAKEGLQQLPQGDVPVMQGGDLDIGRAKLMISKTKGFVPQSTGGKTFEDVRKLREAGRVEEAAKLESTLDTEEVMSMGMDDQGRPIFTIRKGQARPTVATQSFAQQRLLKLNSAMEQVNSLYPKITQENVGVRGKLGTVIIDEGLEQFFPGMAKGSRIDAQAAITAVANAVIRDISGDTRFSNEDRKALQAALPTTGALESAASIKGKLNNLRKVLAIQARNNAAAIEAPVPSWALSPEQVVRQLDAGKLTGEQAADVLEMYPESEIAEAIRKVRGQ